MANKRKMFGGMLNGMLGGNGTMKMVIIALLILFVVVGIIVYYQYNRTVLDNKNSDIANANGNANANGKSNTGKSGMTGSSDTYEEGTLEVMFFNVDWCAHCVKAKPDWQTFVQKYDQQNFHGYKVNCVGGEKGVNCTKSDDEDVKKAIAKYNIQHYPTLIFVQNGSQVEFDARINTQNLDDFMNKL
jgi:thiol-disulfide isomerase/thioredoxin